MQHYTNTQARNNFSELINTVKYGKKIIAIGKNSSQKEVLVIPYPDIDTADLPISQINGQSESFSFLADEVDIYTIMDLKKSYV